MHKTIMANLLSFQFCHIFPIHIVHSTFAHAAISLVLSPPRPKSLMHYQYIHCVSKNKNKQHNCNAIKRFFVHTRLYRYTYLIKTKCNASQFIISWLCFVLRIKLENDFCLAMITLLFSQNSLEYNPHCVIVVLLGLVLLRKTA